MIEIGFLAYGYENSAKAASLVKRVAESNRSSKCERVASSCFKWCRVYVCLSSALEFLVLLRPLLSTSATFAPLLALHFDWRAHRCVKDGPYCHGRALLGSQRGSSSPCCLPALSTMCLSIRKPRLVPYAEDEKLREGAYFKSRLYSPGGLSKSAPDTSSYHCLLTTAGSRPRFAAGRFRAAFVFVCFRPNLD